MAVPTLAVTNTIQNGITADGDDVGQNFTDIETWAASCESAVEALEAADSADVSASKFARNTNVALTAGSSTLVTMESETDPDGWWPGSGTTFTVPVNGVYAINFEVVMLAASGSGSVYVSFRDASSSTTSLLVNDSPLKVAPASGDMVADEGPPGYLTYGGVFRLRAGQTFEVFAQEGGGVSPATIDNVQLSIVKLAEI